MNRSHDQNNIVVADIRLSLSNSSLYVFSIQASKEVFGNILLLNLLWHYDPPSKFNPAIRSCQESSCAHKQV